MAEKTRTWEAGELGDGFEVRDGAELPDEALDAVAGGKVSECRCPNCGNTEEAYISGPNGYYVRYCTKCRTSWPYWV